MQIDLQPTLASPAILLRPLQADDFPSLYAAASDPDIWQQHPDPNRYQLEIFRKGFFASALSGKNAFVVIDRATDTIIGSTRYYDWNPETRHIAVGYTFLQRSHWGTATNADMKKLMLDHAFQFAELVWFHIGMDNLRSRKAIEKLGAVFSHQEARLVAGVATPHAHYKIERPRYPD